jgi:hypothetical protein
MSVASLFEKWLNTECKWNCSWLNTECKLNCSWLLNLTDISIMSSCRSLFGPKYLTGGVTFRCWKMLLSFFIITPPFLFSCLFHTPVLHDNLISIFYLSVTDTATCQLISLSPFIQYGHTIIGPHFLCFLMQRNYTTFFHSPSAPLSVATPPFYLKVPQL